MKILKLAAGIAALVIVGGCFRPALDTDTGKAGERAQVAYAPQMSSGFWAIRHTHCVDCHGANPLPATIDLRTRSSLTTSQVQMVYDGVALEKAPQGHLLATADRDTILRWAVQNGATPYQTTVPSTHYWSQSTQMAGAANGSDGQAPGRFFGFAIEDLARTPLSVENYTDNQSVTRQTLSLQDFHTVNQDSFSLSTHPVNYVMADGVAWGTRVKEFEYAGYVVQDRHMGVFFHSRELRKGPSTAGARDRRTYVRLQVDQDYFAFRSKKAGYTDTVETFPWNTAPADPFLTAQSGYSLGVNGFFLSSSRYYWVKVTAQIVGSVMRYHAWLYQDGPAGTLIAEIGAERSDPSEAFGGYGFFTYTQNTTNHKDRWAGWEMFASSMFGSGQQPGNGTSCRPPCEVD